MQTAENQVFRPLPNYNFLLQVEGRYDVPCKSVKGINRETEYEYIQEGGINDRVHIRKKPASKPGTFQIERYVGTPYEDIFTPDRVFEMPILLLVSRYQEFFLKPSRTYTFSGCRVITKDYGEFRSEQSGFLIENVTIAYDTMKCDIREVDAEAPASYFDGYIPAPHENGTAVKRAAKTASVGVADRKKRKWPEIASAKKYYGKSEK